MLLKNYSDCRYVDVSISAGKAAISEICSLLCGVGWRAFSKGMFKKSLKIRKK